jgi:hypothetical protein
MSRWYLTSSEKADNGARFACQQANLRSSGHISDPNCRGQAYFKRAVTTPNLVRCGENDWICCAGTLVYNGQLGERALQDCYADFVTSGAPFIQSKAIGHYAIAIRRGDDLTIFTDPQGALTLHYANTGSFWFVSNSLQLCAGALSRSKLDSTKLLVAILQSSLPGEDTYYQNVRRLFGTQIIRIALRSGTLRVERMGCAAPTISWRLPTIEDAVRQYVSEVRAVFQEFKAIAPIALLGTGGLDSRTILAALLDQQIRPQLMYGIGNSHLTDYWLGDIEVAKALAKGSNLPFKQLDWSGTQPHSEQTLRTLFQTYGFKYEIYGAPEAFLRGYNGGITPYPKMFLGGYSPAFTNSKPWELKQASFSLDDLVANSMAFQGGTIEESRCIIDKAAYRTTYAEEIRKGLHWADVDFPDHGASLQSYVRAKLFFYIRAESRYLNFVNEFGHYVAPFLMKRLYDPLLNVPLEFRANDEFQIRLIHAFAPALSEVPLFTGWGPARIDRSTFRLVRDIAAPKRSIVERVGRRAQALCSHVEILDKVVGDKATRRDTAIIQTYGREVMNDPLGQRWFNSTSEFAPKIMARIWHYLVGVNTMGYTEE